jgi:O-methyltransferase
MFYKPEYNYDGLSTDPEVIHNHDFMLDERYINAYVKGHENHPNHKNASFWRLHIALWCAAQAQKLEGDFVECGVWRGAISTAIINYLDWPLEGRMFYLFDSWEGLDLLTEEESKQKGKINYLNRFYKDQFSEVQQHFSKYRNVELIKGMVPDTLTKVNIEKVCYLSLDMNCALPEIAAANFFWDKIVKGGMILLDDYGLVQYQEQKIAFNEFAKEKNIEILSLPTGQGLIVKV